MKFLVLLLMFFTISALLIISNHNLYIYEKENMQIFSEIYVEWLEGVYSSVKNITGEVVKQTWLPE